jgi:hypothetical protein
MPDFSDPTTLASHGVASLTSGGLGAWLMNFIRSRDEKREKAEQSAAVNAMNTTLLRQGDKLDTIIGELKEHKAVFADVVELKLMVKALHSRVDDLEKKRKGR